MYYFCVHAYNLAGESAKSDTVNCMTLGVGESAMQGTHQNSALLYYRKLPDGYCRIILFLIPVKVSHS